MTHNLSERVLHKQDTPFSHFIDKDKIKIRAFNEASFQSEKEAALHNDWDKISIHVRLTSRLTFYLNTVVTSLCI